MEPSIDAGSPVSAHPAATAARVTEPVRRTPPCGKRSREQVQTLFGGLDRPAAAIRAADRLVNPAVLFPSREDYA